MFCEHQLTQFCCESIIHNEDTVLAALDDNIRDNVVLAFEMKTIVANIKDLATFDFVVVASCAAWETRYLELQGIRISRIYILELSCNDKD